MILKYGSKGANVADLQKQLSNKGYKSKSGKALAIDGDFGEATEYAVMQFQKTVGLKVDGIVGNATYKAMKNMDTSKLLKDADLIAGAKRLGVDEIVVRAIAEVESQGEGFLDDNIRPKILFERHRMYHYLSLKKGKAYANQMMQKYPNIVNAASGGYKGGSSEYIRISTAKMIDVECALQSASWGRFQLMGENWKDLGYESVQDFVNQHYQSETLQFEAFLRYCEWKSGTIKNEKITLLDALKNHNWHAVFTLYNGSNYKRLGYDAKFKRVINRLDPMYLSKVA
ncbi:N-acetylmuramidase domain-containing protein [Acinetobacter bereziniae]|uniref:N-acetylmuramidase domain-containing protein n=1 Tax=Acinetobacter bereziniae TaxID=106648 RepID=UPI003AF977A7